MTEISLTFKNTRILENFCKVRIHKNLIILIDWFEGIFGTPTVTSAFRETGVGVHTVEPLRGIDIRSYIYSNAKSIEETINKIWEYDPKRQNLQSVYECI